MIKFADFLTITGIRLSDFKIHCVTYGSSPLIALLKGEFKEWQESQGNKNVFPCKYVVSLIQLCGDRWLFAGVFEIKKVERRQDKTYHYTTLELAEFEDLVGRVIVSFKKPFRATYLNGPTHLDKFIVTEYLPERLSVVEFPGFKEVRLPHDQLTVIVRQNKLSWKIALSNVSGIYLIVDMNNGKQYVGSAYGEGGIWGRWVNYAETGHGGNIELINLLKNNGAAYAYNFQYSILEITDLQSTKDSLLKRENHWKDALCTRQFGYNSN